MRISTGEELQALRLFLWCSAIPDSFSGRGCDLCQQPYCVEIDVVRQFPVVRETNLEFRVEYFNVLNHTNLSNPSTNNPVSSSTTFGTITGAGDPRIAQFALKYTF
jgi:hypothetical protein